MTLPKWALYSAQWTTSSDPQFKWGEKLSMFMEKKKNNCFNNVNRRVYVSDYVDRSHQPY